MIAGRKKKEESRMTPVSSLQYADGWQRPSLRVHIEEKKEELVESGRAASSGGKAQRGGRQWEESSDWV